LWAYKVSKEGQYKLKLAALASLLFKPGASVGGQALLVAMKALWYKAARCKAFAFGQLTGHKKQHFLCFCP